MKLTMLGTGNAMVTECYNTCFLLREGEESFLVDGGGGSLIFQRLKAAGVDWKTIRHLFITHKHVDHLMGILWMVRMITQNMSRGGYEGEAVIYGHEEVIGLIRQMSTLLYPAKFCQFIDDRLKLQVLSDGEEFSVLGREARAFDIGSTKAKQFGFCVYENEKPFLTCCGDEPYNPREYPYARETRWLLHEAFCLHGEADRFHPYEKHHSTVKDACELAQELHAQNLILYHTEDQNYPRRKELYTAEGQQYYSGNLYVPYDLESFDL